MEIRCRLGHPQKGGCSETPELGRKRNVPIARTPCAAVVFILHPERDPDIKNLVSCPRLQRSIGLGESRAAVTGTAVSLAHVAVEQVAAPLNRFGIEAHPYGQVDHPVQIKIPVPRKADGFHEGVHCIEFKTRGHTKIDWPRGGIAVARKRPGKMLENRSEAELGQGFGRMAPPIRSRQFNIQQMWSTSERRTAIKTPDMDQTEASLVPSPQQARIFELSQPGHIFRDKERVEGIIVEDFRNGPRR